MSPAAKGRRRRQWAGKTQVQNISLCFSAASQSQITQHVVFVCMQHISTRASTNAPVALSAFLMQTRLDQANYILFSSAPPHVSWLFYTDEWGALIHTLKPNKTWSIDFAVLQNNVLWTWNMSAMPVVQNNYSLFCIFLKWKAKIKKTCMCIFHIPFNTSKRSLYYNIFTQIVYSLIF